MTQELWSAVDAYVSGLLIPPDEALDSALAESARAGLPSIAVSPLQGKLLSLYVRLMGAKRVLEIGTLGGYSTIWMARGLTPGGRITSLEFDPKHAAVASSNFSKAGLEDVVDVRVGRAIDTLPQLEGPYDFIFIDADKASIPEYFEWAVRLSRAGSVIVVDNVIRDGAVVDARSGDANIIGVRRFNDLVSRDARVSATEIQTVGAKGHDGFAFIVVR